MFFSVPVETKVALRVDGNKLLSARTETKREAPIPTCPPLTEIYAYRSTHFSHFGSLNKVLQLLILFVLCPCFIQVPILNTSTLERLVIEIDTPDHGDYRTSDWYVL